MVEARIENGQVDLYDASSGMYRRTIRTRSKPTKVTAEGDEVAITVQDGTTEIYDTQGSHKRTAP
jgi:hypothetical protein